MPNWINNAMTVSGPADDIARFKTAAASPGQALSLDRLMPYPDAYREADRLSREWKLNNWITEKDGRGRILRDGVRLEDCPQDGFNHGGCEWRYDNWGTKWDLCDVFIHRDSPYEIIYWFRTANGDPQRALLRISTLYPSLHFKLVSWVPDPFVQIGQVVELQDGAVRCKMAFGGAVTWPCPVCGNVISSSDIKITREADKTMYEAYYQCGDPSGDPPTPDRCGFSCHANYADDGLDDIINVAADEYAAKHKVLYDAVPPCQPACVRYNMEVSSLPPHKLVKRCRVTGYWCRKGEEPCQPL